MLSSAYRASPWTFKSWLSRFTSVDLPIGDLANDVVKDTGFPDSESFEVIQNYLLNRNVNYKVLDCFKEVWDFYQASK